MKLKLYVYILVIFFVLNCFAIEKIYDTTTSFNNTSLLNVLIYQTNKLKINAVGDIKVISKYKENKYSSTISISHKNQSLIINGDEYTPPVNIIADSPNTLLSLAFNKRSYRGNFLLDIEYNRVLVINRVDLEDYLYGVIKSEISSSWPAEAIKAQVIASRTYALFKKNQKKDKKFHLVATISSQVYKGFDNESFITNQLVDATKGIIITYNKEPIEAVFHSCCGGFTEDSESVWTDNLPYLKSTYSEYCKNTEKFSWQKVVYYRDITKVLYEKFNVFSRISYLQIGETTNSRRVTTLICVDEKNINHEISTKEFRLIFGTKDIPSTLFTLKNDGEFVVLNGRGNGHGVGLCQICTREMAERGKKYEDIIFHFYKNIKIGKFIKIL